MQELFFDQLRYYPLRKVQANQDSVSLMDADFRWATYYSSIYLQSKDYGNLAISTQNDAVFQGLPGLQFTYSIHAIDVKRRKAERELKLVEENLKAHATTIDVVELRQSLNEVKDKLKKLRENPQKELIQTIQRRIAMLIKHNAVFRKEKSALDDRIYQGGKHIGSPESEIESKLDILKHYKREVIKAKRLINENQEYMDSGIFFPIQSVGGSIKNQFTTKSRGW